MDPSKLFAAWKGATLQLLPTGAAVWDAHTHTGDRDPDGFTNTAEQLLAALDDAGHRGAVICPSLDPSGYRDANDRVLAESEASTGRLVPFLRVDPNDVGAAAEAERSLDAGHRGVKLHPRGEGFSMDHPMLDQVAGLAVERGAPLLVHAGRGMPPLGRPLLDLVDRHPPLMVILAHCGISDLDALASELSDRPGILFDTAWWNAADVSALFQWVDAGRIMYASDYPYGWPALSLVRTVRGAVQAGLGPEAIGAVAGGNLEQILAHGRPPQELGTAQPPPLDLRLLRISTYLSGAIATAFAGGDPVETAELALRACDGPWPAGRADAIGALRDLIGLAVGLAPEMRRPRLGLLMLAASVALTPEVPVPGA